MLHAPPLSRIQSGFALLNSFARVSPWARTVAFFSATLDDRAAPLEQRLFRLICFITAALALVIILPLNLVQHLPVWVNVGVSIIGGFAAFCLRESLHGRHYLVSFAAFVTGGLDVIWCYNGGSEGSVPFYFFAVALYLLAVFRGRARWAFLAVLALNTSALFAAEHLWPVWVTPLANASVRVIDLITGMACSGLALVLIARLIIAAHDHERRYLAAATRQLADSERNYREIFWAAGEAMLVLDRNGRVMDVNQAVLDLFRIDRFALIQQDIGDLSIGRSFFTREHAQQRIVRALTDGPQAFLWGCRRPDFSLFAADVTMRPAYFLGEARIVATFRPRE